MSIFLALKVVHVLSAIVAVGANVTYAFWLRRAGRDRDQLVYSIEGIRRMDRTMANPGYILVLLTGLGMVATGTYDLGQRWLEVALGLYVLTAVLGILAFAPAIRRQLDEAKKDPTSDAYAAAARRSNALGALTTAIVVVIVIMMVAKPF